ncbi:hypothetical protein JCM3263A_25170 [Thermobifida fusca]
MADRPRVTPFVVSEFPAQRRFAVLASVTSTMHSSARDNSNARSVIACADSDWLTVDPFG